MTATISTLLAIETELNSYFLDRREVVRGMLLAIISKQHLLMVGAPGSAKSAIARALSAHLTGGRYFETLLTKFTPPEDVFGPVAVSKLVRDVHERKTVGYAPEAELVMIDEVGKASNAILNSFLTLMNERVFHNGGVAVPCPLMTLVGASNELPDGDELAALFDRFLLRFEVNYLQEDDFVVLMDGGDDYTPSTHLTWHDLVQVQALVNQVALPQAVLASIVRLRRELRAEGIIVSDRRWKAGRKLLAANALLSGRMTIEEDDMEVLSHSLWRRPSEMPLINQKIAAVSNPLKAEVLSLLDTLHNLRKTVDDVAQQTGKGSTATTAAAADAQEKFKQVGAALKKLDGQHAGGRHEDLIKDALRRASALHKGFLQDHMNYVEL